MFAVAGLVGGVALSVIWKPLYRSTGTLVIERGQDSPSRRIRKGIRAALDSAYLEDLIRRENLYRQEQDTLPLPDVVGRMRRDVEIARTGPPGILRNIEVSFRYGDSGAAKRVTGALVDRILHTIEHSLAAGANDNSAPVVLQTAGLGCSDGGVWVWRRLTTFSTRVPPRFVCRGEVAIRSREAVEAANPTAGDISGILQDAEVLKRALVQFAPDSSEASLGKAIAGVRSRLRWDTGDSANVLTISYADERPDRAQRLLTALLQACLWRATERRAAAGDGRVLEMIAPPSLPKGPTGTRTGLLIVGAMLLSLATFGCWRLVSNEAGSQP